MGDQCVEPGILWETLKAKDNSVSGMFLKKMHILPYLVIIVRRLSLTLNK